MDDTTQKVIDQIEKLLRVAAKTSNEAEAAAFTSKANALLAAHNLTVSEVEASSGEGISGRRLDEQVSGGMYKYQQKLWRNIAELNFCMYWSMLVRTKEGTKKFKRGRKYTNTHRLVGRQVNVIATKNMATYLNGVIERLCRERLQDRTDDIVKGNNQFYSRWAIAFREGVADRVVDKIQDRQAEVLDAEARKVKAAARKASRAGLSVSTALTLASLTEREEQANYDFLHGAGAWARKKAKDEEYEREWQEHRAAAAASRALAEKQYAQWAKANPEEAAAEERKTRNRERARERQRERRGGGWGRMSFRESPEDLRRNSGGYHAGWDAGEKVSIDQQAGVESRKKIGHG